MAFIPLHIRSGFSFLRSALTVEKIPLLLKKYNFTIGGITDLNTLSGLAPFYHEMKKVNLTPIFGEELTFLNYSFIIFIENEVGYRNLLAINNDKDSLTFQTFFKEGLSYIVLSSSIKDVSQLESLTPYLKKVKHFYIGLLAFEEKEKVKKIRDWARNHDIKVIATPLFLYEKPVDQIALRILEAIEQKTNLEIEEESGPFALTYTQKLSDFFTEEEIENTNIIFNNCNDFQFLEKRGKILKYPSPISSEAYLRQLCEEGLKDKGLNDKPEYHERMEYELKIILDMHYEDYFFLVHDYVNFARNNGILVGPGRGSGAGSLVTYLLNITLVDPLKYDLYFERFLNPARKSLPDIDVDFQDTRREEVVNYLIDKFGKDKVAHVLAVQTIGAKEALRDISRVYKKYSDNAVNQVIQTIINDRLSLREDYKTSKPFKNIVDSDKFYLQMVALASKIEGLPRQKGLHAAGLVINDEPLKDCAPTSYDAAIGATVLLEKDYLEEQGFLKMDLLGLRNLSIVSETLNRIKIDTGKTLKYEDIPYEDKESISLITEGLTMGLFQLESSGIKQAIKLLKPTEFLGVALLEAIYRPGPMQEIQTFARRKDGREKVTYIDDDLKDILSQTYGIIIYQEQIMQIAQKMAGFTFGEADLFRRAISKKNHEAILKEKARFIEGALKKNKTRQQAEEVFELIERFASYGFNKSHAVAYAYLTCQMAYLKKHYPLEFYCSLLDTLDLAEKKARDTMSEMRRFNIKILIPSVQDSSYKFVVHNNNLLLPLSSIKNVGTIFIHNLLDEREENGPYIDFFDFVKRAKKSGLTLPLLIRLIDSGSLDCFNVNRATLRATAPRAIKYAEMFYGKDGTELLLNFDFEKPAYQEDIDDPKLNFNLEKETLGIALSVSPLSTYKDEVKRIHAISLGDIDKMPNGTYEVLALLKSVKTITTKKGKPMAFVSVYDDLNDNEFIMWDEEYTKYYSLLDKDEPLFFKIQITRGKRDSYIIREIKKPEEQA